MKPVFLLVFVMLAGCASGGSASIEEETKPVRIASMNTGVAPGDCPEALRRARQKPDLDVDRIPSPLAMKPAPLRNVPATALRKDGSADVKVDVIIDTLGHADMKTFKVVSASNPWLASNVKGVISKWKFQPAQLAGCKVPRVYHFMAATPGRSTK
jgi:outer membrane biosynthesis protein TonB